MDEPTLLRRSSLLQPKTTSNEDALQMSTPLISNIALHELELEKTPHGTNSMELKNKDDMLYPQFLEVLHSHNNDSDILETVGDFKQICGSILIQLQADMQRGFGTKEMQATINWLKMETNTWELLRALYRDRLRRKDDEEQGDNGMALFGTSERLLVQQLYEGTATLREYQLVVDWLESIYERPPGAILAHTNEGSHCWEHTLFQMENKRATAFSKNLEIVTQLDPDAPIREKRPLHALDEEDELRLVRCIFAEIRMGRIEAAQAVCKSSGQYWRAAMLEGWRLHEDPNYELSTAGVSEKIPIEGNPRRDIWKKTAWMMAESKKHNIYTRAIAGVYCAHLESLTTLLSNNWHDLLWAYLKAQIDIRVESEMRACIMKRYIEMPEDYWKNKMTLEQIFAELAVAKDANVRNFAKGHMGIIQKHIIMDSFNDLLLQMCRWLDEPEGLSKHQLRFLTHLILFMRQIRRVDQMPATERIIAAYCESLMPRVDAQLIAFYTSSLPNQLQIKIYGKYMEGITESKERKIAFKAALQAGLDVENITRYTVENMCARIEDTNASAVPQIGIITEDDENRIKCLEWLTFLPEQRGELLWQANSMMRNYLAQSKMECVRAVYLMVPSDTTVLLEGIYGHPDNFPCREECCVKEYMCYKIYLAALDSFNDWLRVYHSRPKAPEKKKSDANNFTERVAKEQKEKIYNIELDRWELQLKEQSKVTSVALYNVLLFPRKGWLVDPDTDKTPSDDILTSWEHRRIQMDKLRTIYIPDIVLLLHEVLHKSSDYKGCVKITEEVANERRQLYKVFTPYKMQQLLAKIAESSKELIKQGLDAWGYHNTV